MRNAALGHIFELFLRIPATAAHYLDMDTKLVDLMLRDLQAKTERLVRDFAKFCESLPGHIDDHDLERYHLGMVKDEGELAALEEHLLWCGVCVDRAEATQRYVDAVRAAACE
jgi:hypothetical protein